MTDEELKKLSQEIERISNCFEPKPWTENVKLLKEDFDINSVSTPKYYWKIVREIEEILRETRLLFIISMLNRACKEEGKLYYFNTPYQASMRYDAIMKKEDNFYLLDEDGDYGEIFTSEAFAYFIKKSFIGLYD